MYKVPAASWRETSSARGEPRLNYCSALNLPNLIKWIIKQQFAVCSWDLAKFFFLHMYCIDALSGDTNQPIFGALRREKGVLASSVQPDF